MRLFGFWKRWKTRRRKRIIEGPCEDGGVRTRHDTEAPKEILSRDLARFLCSFSTVSYMEEDVPVKIGFYTLSATISEDGMVLCQASFEGRETIRNEEKKSSGFLKRLDELLRQYNIAMHNGRYYHVSGLPKFYGATLEADYLSGETIRCYNNQDMFFPLPFLGELCQLFSIGEKEGA